MNSIRFRALLGLLILCPLLGAFPVTSTFAECVPADPAQSGVVIEPPPQDCHFVFYPDGSRDHVRALVALHDENGGPICDARVEMEILGLAGTLKTCPGMNTVSGFTNDEGVVTLSLGALCGCGIFEVRIRSFCTNDLGSARLIGEFGPFRGTSPDLNGSCHIEERPVNVIDLGIWATCQDSLDHCCDFNCDGKVGIIDLGIWAGALLTNCP